VNSGSKILYQIPHTHVLFGILNTKYKIRFAVPRFQFKSVIHEIIQNW